MDEQIKRLSKNFQTLIFGIAICVTLFSCSANYHILRAIKKGYTCGDTADTITISTIDSIPYVLRDSIYWEKVIVQKDTIVRYKRSYVPQTRFQTRIEYRYKTKVVKAEVQKIKYQNKYITKTKINWFVVILAFIVGFLVRLSFSETFRSRLQLLTKLFR
jgi:hypothetical protein